MFFSADRRTDAGQQKIRGSGPGKGPQVVQGGIQRQAAQGQVHPGEQGGSAQEQQRDR